MMRRELAASLLLASTWYYSITAIAQENAAAAPRPIPTPEEYALRSERFSKRLEASLDDEFVGITSKGERQADLFPIRSTGVSTEPVVNAAESFLASLTDDQRASSTFAVDDIEWRKWANQHIYRRAGVSFEQMTATQRDAAVALLAASLSAKGLTQSQNIMKLDHTLGELNNDNFVEYGEGKYHLTVMGSPSTTTPWGWQLDGHHLNINYFVLGDQVVMTPAFWGSEPAVAHAGKFAGTRVLDQEQIAGLNLIRSLDESQRQQAVLDFAKPGNNILAQAFSDNLVLDYAGVRAASFSTHQKDRLMDLIMLYVGNLRDDHAVIHQADVAAHLNDTYFAWIGDISDDAVFYYRIHSPVILIEFDHETPVGLRHMQPDVPNREHIHAVVRTPNGNDYGRDLLRQHYQQHPH